MDRLKELQKVELEILLEVDRICKKHGIVYFLDSGTALGAIRHNGFIPWDDDIDIGMMRSDYDLFLKIAGSELEKEGFFLQTLETDNGCPCLFAKVRKKDTLFLENNKKGMNMEMGIYIDVFPFDFIHTDVRSQLKLIRKTQLLKLLFMTKKIPHIQPGKNTPKHVIKTIIRKGIHVLLQPIPDSFFVNSINKRLAEVVDKEYVSCVYYGKPKVFKYKELLPTRETNFENHSLPVVKNIDYYLKISYGDYMKLPPIEKQVGHLPSVIVFDTKNKKPS